MTDPHPIPFLRARASWYREGCPNLEDGGAYARNENNILGQEAANDLDDALDAIQRALQPAPPPTPELTLLRMTAEQWRDPFINVLREEVLAQVAQGAALDAENARLKEALENAPWKASYVSMRDECEATRAELRQAREHNKDLSHEVRRLAAEWKEAAADRDRPQRHWDALRAWLAGQANIHPMGQMYHLGTLKGVLAHLDHLAGKE